MTFSNHPIGMDGDRRVEFEEVLVKLLSTDNDIRSSAESVYDTISACNRLELLMTAVADTSKTEEARQLSLVLLRRLFTNDYDEICAKLSAEEQAAMKQHMLNIVKQDASNKSSRKKTCDAVSELARNLIDDEANNGWPEILQFLFECVHSQEPGLKECALNIFTTVPTIFGNQQSQNLQLIKQMLASCLSEQSEVCFLAARAACSFLVANESDQAVFQYLKDLLPGILNAVTLSIQQQTDDMLLKCLIDVAESAPKYLRPQIEAVLDLCIKVIENAELEDSWRQLSLEIVTTLAETASAMIRKHASRIPQLVVLILRLMCDIEDEEDWSVQDEMEEEEADSNAVAAETALDRLACGLGGKTILPQIVANIPALLSSPDWKCRHAALMAISACGEGCHKQMESMLGQILESIIPFTRDVHPRVRYAACNALGQMSTDFAPNLQKKHHNMVLPALLSVLDCNNDEPRVQAHSGAALVNFCEDCPKHIMAPYLEAIINNLAKVLNCKFNELVQRGNKLVLEQIVTTLATVADSVEDRFVDYYDQFIPSLKIIIENANDASLRLLRGKTIECVSLIGLAVGRDKFLQDCDDVMRLLLASQTQDMGLLDDDDPQVSYLISAWARMCKILGKDFEQYLPMVMPPVLKAAAVKPEVALLDTDEMKGMENDSDWQFVTLGDQQNFGIRTSGLEDKATACQMLVCYARELKQGFSPYTKEVTEIMVPLLKFYFHDECRVAAAECLPYMLDCAQIQGKEYLSEMWKYILPQLLISIESEPEKDIQAEIMHSLAECIERVGENALDETQTTDLVQIIKNLLDAHSERQSERQEQRKDEDYDEDVEESLINEDDEDVYILSKISDIIHALFGTMKANFLPVFDSLLQHFTKLLKDDAPWPDRQWGLCIFDDVIEYTGAAALKYANYFSGAILKGLADSQPEVRQAAAYGVGIMAMFGENVYAEFLRETLPLLINIIQESTARDLENINATENAISAATKIFKYSPGDLNSSEFIPTWLSWLPVWEDGDEALHIYSYLCDLFEAQRPELFGENGSNLPKIVSIIAQVFRKEVLDNESEVMPRLKQCIASLQSNVDLITACIEQLDPLDKEALFKEMNS